MMNKFLAELYGTGAEDSEKTASAEASVEEAAQFELLEKIAAGEGVDINGMTEDDIGALYNEVFVQDTAANPAGLNDMEKEAQARFDEADFMGRVMAHAYHQEKVELDKTAAKEEDDKKDKNGKGDFAALMKYKKGEKGDEKMEKQSMIDALAIDRANDFLSGFQDADGNLLADPVNLTKISSELVNETVDARAVEMLEAEGYSELFAL